MKYAIYQYFGDVCDLRDVVHGLTEAQRVLAEYQASSDPGADFVIGVAEIPQCKNCKWWEAPIVNPRTRKPQPVQGFCMHDMNDEATSIQPYCEDGHVEIRLMTGPDFGCLQFTSKEGTHEDTYHHRVYLWRRAGP